jgi:hypothetical protein
MKLSIYNEAETRPEPELKLALRQRHDGRIVLCVMRDDGTEEPCGHIGAIKTDGTMELCTGIDRKLGLQLDDEEHIVTRKD